MSTTTLLGCIILDEAVLDQALKAKISPKYFEVASERLVFETMIRMKESGLPIALDTLAGELGHRLNEVGLDNLMKWSDITEIQDPAGVGLGIIEKLKGAGAEAKVNLLLSKRVRASAPPVEPVTRLWLADKPICTPGNITTLTSKAKTGKTAALGAAVAAIIDASAGTQALQKDTFKFRAGNPAGHAVIVFDTEQSPFDAYQCYLRSLKRAGVDTDPPWLYHFALVGLTPRQLFDSLDTALEIGRTECGGIFSVILDGCSDFVASVNDEAECNGFVTWLRTKTVDFDTSAIVVIHSNEGDKAGLDSRGHLGKQLIRKAESNLLLKKDGEVTTITSEKQRKAPITEADGVAFRWSEKDGHHVSCEAVELKKKSGGRSKLHSIHDFWDCIPAKGASPLTGTQLHRFAIQIADIKANTFKDLLAESAKDGLLVRTYDGKTGYSYTRAV